MTKQIMYEDTFTYEIKVTRLLEYTAIYRIDATSEEHAVEKAILYDTTGADLDSGTCRQITRSASIKKGPMR
jgi:hypothetical protein